MTASEVYSATAPRAATPAIRFDRNEFAGAFGDIGTDLPLIIGMILAAGLHSASVLVMFGVMQYVTALTYRMPMPVQPLKAVAVLVITQKVAPGILYGGGLAIGIVMLVLAATGAITWLARVVPRPVVRGLQLGLGIQLSMLALHDYVRSDGIRGYVLAGVSFVIIAAFLGNRRIPPALIVIGLGVVYALVFKLSTHDFVGAAGFTLPQVRSVRLTDMIAGLTLLAIPQIPLSLGNSVLATRQVAEDLFPERDLTVRKLSFTYSAMNLINPFFGGVPTCHGSGGMIGHYTFGARTGGSILIYGTLFLILGLFFAAGFQQVVQVFPLPVLGVLLFFEGVVLMLFTRSEAGNRRDFFIMLATGVIANGLPYGYATALVIGTLLYYGFRSLLAEPIS